MKKSLNYVLAILLSLALCLGGITMSISTVLAEVANVSDSEAQLSLRAAQEGMVLFKNDNNSLPFADTMRTVALFGGAGAMQTGTSGTGAESNLPGYTISVYQGLKNAGFTITSEEWLQSYNEAYQEGYSQWDEDPNWNHYVLPETRLDGATIEAASKDTDTAIYVVRRLAGEGSDRKVEKGDYLLTDNEQENLKDIAAAFDNVVLLLNTCGPIDMSFLDSISNIDSILYMSLPGMEAGNAVANILTGKANPCGKLAATWTKTYADYPSAKTFSNTSTQYLSEDIYVGYRYFESFGNEKVMYPFGYGLSYTTFGFSNVTYTNTADTITVSVTVTNTGAVAGKEVVQIYYGAPQGKLGKSAVSLIAYEKTNLLAAGESQTLSLTFAIADMASYDDEGVTGNASCYVLEAGEYPIYLGNSCVNAQQFVAGTYTLNELKVTERLTRYVAPVASFDKTVNTENGKATQKVTIQASTADMVPADAGKEEMKYSGDPITYQQMLENPTVLLDSYIGQFTAAELAELVRLTPGGGAGIAGGKLPGAPTMDLADGVCGLKYPGTNDASYPCPTCLAQTFDDDLVQEVATAVAKILKEYNHETVLAPGVNIQQNPLCGRNFGYFSEDPLLSGNMGAAYVIGVQSQGIGAVPKHFAANNKEDGRQTVNSVASERALREIYLKSFQVTVEKGEPWAIMTSYNRINGVETAERTDLTNGILRGEWGFQGMVMTDWSNDSNEIKEKLAGNDLNTYGLSASAEALAGAVNNGQLSMAALQQAAKNVLKFVMKSYQNQKKGVYAGIQTVYMDKASKFEAEAFNRKSTNAADVNFEKYDGGLVPTNTNNGKNFYYALEVELGGRYRIVPHVAAMTTEGSLTFTIGEDVAVTSKNFVTTGGWHNYIDQEGVEIFLPSGSCEVRITCNGANYNMDYFTVEPMELSRTVLSVERPDAIQVDYNTPFENLTLPTTLVATLSDDSQVTVGVVWSGASYSHLRDGQQTLQGTLVVPEGVANYMNLLAYITVDVAENPNPVTRVRISNKPTSLKQGESFTFTVLVEGKGEFNPAVEWSVNSLYSTITQDGVLTVSNDETSSTLMVTVASVTNPEKKHSVSVKVEMIKDLISATKPTRLFGEKFTNASATFTKEDCQDETGGKNLQDFNNSDWIEFACTVEAGGTYDLVFRYASPVDKQSTMKFLCDGQVLAESEKLRTTGGWQTWANTDAHRITLPAGDHILRVQANGVNFNFNYVELTPVEVELPKKYTLEGVVTGTDAPQDVTVTLSYKGNKVDVVPDEKGVFQFADLDAGTYEVTVKGEGVEDFAATVTLPMEEPLVVILVEKAPPEPPAPAYGDVNGDEKIDAKDALMVLKNAVGKLELNESQTVVADVSGDGKIDAKDALYILRFSVGTLDRFPVEK